MKTLTKLSLLAAALIVAGPGNADNDDDRHRHRDPHAQKHPHVLKVNCNRGQTITRALKRARPGDTIRVRGICRERVTITTDRITLAGGNKAALDGTGVPPGDVEFKALITVDGASGVVVRELTLRNNDPAEGVHVIRGAHAVLEKLTIKGNFRGVRADGASVEMNRLTVSDGRVGVQLTGGARCQITGDLEVYNITDEAFSLLSAECEHRDGEMRIHHNGMFSFLVAAGSTFTILGCEACSSSISVTDNLGDGILLANGTLEFGGVTAQSPLVESLRNGRAGIGMAVGGTLLNVVGWVNVVLAENRHGVAMSSGSTLMSNGGLTVHDNLEGGIEVSDSRLILAPGPLQRFPVSIENNGTGPDVDLKFGARSTIEPGVSIGSPLVCDGTVLSQDPTNPNAMSPGAMVCP